MLLVGLIALGGILFALLLICIILTCWKHNRPNGRRRTVVPGIDILPHKTLTVHSGSKTGTLQDRRAMIEDTSSETSEDSLQLPYVAKKVNCIFFFISTVYSTVLLMIFYSVLEIATTAKCTIKEREKSHK